MKPKIKDLEKKEYLSTSELAEVAGYRFSTIKFYSEQGILPFEQRGYKAHRRFKKDQALKRLKLIRKLKRRKNNTIPDIKKEIQNL